MYHVSAQGIDERMINAHYYYYYKVSSFELYKFDPFSPHSGSIPRELVHSHALSCL